MIDHYLISLGLCQGTAVNQTLAMTLSPTYSRTVQALTFAGYSRELLVLGSRIPVLIPWFIWRELNAKIDFPGQALVQSMTIRTNLLNRYP